MLKRVALTPAMLMVAALLGCQRSETSEPGRKVEAAAIREQLTDAEIDTYLDGGQMSVVPSQVRNITGDLRPNWIVTGRIKSNYPRDIKSVRVRLIAYDKDKASNTVLDTAEFTVEDVPALEAKAFRRQVQLMVSPQQFRFTWTILSATLKTEK